MAAMAAAAAAPESAPAPVAKAEVPKVTQGTLIEQTLERPLRPDEVSLDELERAFRETAIDVAPAPAAAPAPVAEKAEVKEVKAKPAKPTKPALVPKPAPSRPVLSEVVTRKHRSPAVASSTMDRLRVQLIEEQGQHLRQAEGLQAPAVLVGPRGELGKADGAAVRLDHGQAVRGTCGDVPQADVGHLDNLEHVLLRDKVGGPGPAP